MVSAPPLSSPAAPEKHDADALLADFLAQPVTSASSLLLTISPRERIRLSEHHAATLEALHVREFYNSRTQTAEFSIATSNVHNIAVAWLMAAVPRMVAQGFIRRDHLAVGGGADDSSDSTDYDDIAPQRTRFVNLIANSELSTFCSGSYDGSTMQPHCTVHERFAGLRAP